MPPPDLKTSVFKFDTNKQRSHLFSSSESASLLAGCSEAVNQSASWYCCHSQTFGEPLFGLDTYKWTSFAS